MTQFKINRTYDVKTKTYKMSYSNYLTNFLYNIVEEKNKGSYFFISKLKEMMEQKGHEVHFIEDDEEKEDKKEEENNKKEEKDILFLDKTEPEDKKNEFYMKIIESKLINNNEYEQLLSLKNQNKATEGDKILITKKYFSDALQTKNLSYKQLKTWYYNLYKIKNYRSLLDIDNFKKSNEIKNELLFEKVTLVKTLINNLGLSITNNNKTINDNELKNNFKDEYNNNKLYNSPLSSSMFHDIPKLNLTKETTIKQILGNINTILKEFSIKINTTKKQVNFKPCQVYYIEALDGVDNILKVTNEQTD